MKITGTDGNIRAGGRLAARLVQWKHESGTANSTTRATASEIDEFWLDGAASLVLSLRVGKKYWTWRDVNVMRDGVELTIHGRGRPETRAV